MTKLAIAATLADLALLLVALAVFGPGAEQNPAVRAAIEHGALALVVAAKCALVVVIVAWDQAIGRHALAVKLAATAVGVAGVLSWVMGSASV